MRTKLQTICIAILLFLLSLLSLPASEASPTPKRFMASIGGFLGETFQVELRGNSVSYTKLGAGHRDPKSTIVTPTPARWREFREAIDELNIWLWRPAYPNTGTADGTQWALEIVYADHALKACGDNNYPEVSGKANGNPEPTKSFKLYLAAVEKLLGGRNFQ